MAGNGLTDEEARQFWKDHRKLFGSTIPKAVKEVCEIALLGGALLVAHRFSESMLLLGLYWLLLFAFGCRFAARIAFPKEYDSPLIPILLGLAVTGAITFAEDRAIRSAADAALIQVQSEKAATLLATQAKREKEAARIQGAWTKNRCFDDEGFALGKYNYQVCGKLAKERDQNQRLTEKLLRP